MRAVLRLASGGILALSALCSLPDASAGDNPSGLPAEIDGGLPQVLTPARLKQAQADVAASVTVIDREMIAALGARDIPELLRLVPGMMVTRVSGTEYSVNYHGTNLRDIRRLQVLVDGMSVYQPGLARILWSDLALSIEDIERIEVTRGPDAAAYGANAFSAIINIISVHPQDTGKAMLRVAGGSRETLDAGGHFAAHSASADYRLSISGKSDSGYDLDRFATEYRDDRAGGVLNWRSEFRPGDNDRIELFAGIKDGANEEVAETYDVLNRYEQAPRIDVQNMHLMARWNRDLSPDQVLQVQAYTQYTTIRNRWRACLPPILLSAGLGQLYAENPDAAMDLLDLASTNPPPAAIMAFIAALPTVTQQLAAQSAVLQYQGFALAGFNETCGDGNFDVDEGRVDIEVQDTLRVSDTLRLVTGAAWRRDRGSSETYTHGAFHNDVWRLFGHGEWRVLEPLTLNLGAMLESDDISGSNLSPRAGLNWRVAERHTFRAVISRAIRTQDIYEEYANIGLTFRNLSGPWPAGQDTQDFFVTRQSPATLEPEEITARELGYYGFFPASRVDVDVRVFREHLGKLVSDPANLFSFQVDNDSYTDLSGVEGQVRRSIAPGSWAWASYAYIDNDSSHPIEKKFTARHSGSVAVAHRFAARWQGSAAWFVNRYQNYRASRWSQEERLDLRIARDIPLGGATLQLSANGQCRFDDEPEIFDDNRYDERWYGYFGAQLTF